MFERRGGMWRGVLVAVVAALVAAACSGSDDATPSSSPTSDGSGAVESNGDFQEVGGSEPIPTGDGVPPVPTTDPPVEGTPDEPPVDNGGPTTTVAPADLPAPDQIDRIVSLSSSHTETLFALGLGELVVAVDNESDYPDEALAVRDPELDSSSSNLDAVLAYDPDLVLVGDDPTGIAGRLNAADVPTWVGPRPDSLDGVYIQIEEIAALVGQPELADELVGSMRTDVDGILASLPSGATDAGLTFFHEIDPSLFTASSDSFISAVYSTLGLTNIAGSGDSGGVTQMTNDEVIAADPNVIVLADVDCCDVTPERVATRPGWGNVSAVSDGAVIGVSDPLAMRWGPRVIELLELVAGGVAAAAG